MATMPKRVKFRKSQRGKIRGVAQRGNEVSFGEFGLQSLTPAWIPANVIEACRVAAVRGAPEGRLYIRIFPHKSVTSTPEETRMGTGKGEPLETIEIPFGTPGLPFPNGPVPVLSTPIQLP